MAAAKFVLVCAWYMHMKQDNPFFRRLLGVNLGFSLSCFLSLFFFASQRNSQASTASANRKQRNRWQAMIESVALTPWLKGGSRLDLVWASAPEAITNLRLNNRSPPFRPSFWREGILAATLTDWNAGNPASEAARFP